MTPPPAAAFRVVSGQTRPLVAAYWGIQARVRLKEPHEPPFTDAGARQAPLDFIREAVTEDLKSGRFDHVHTRFPPEPNAYLHIGHAKAVWIDYGVAADFGGKFNLRFDDTNPAKEEQEYVDAIIEDVRWLGADWGDRLFFASDYFDADVRSGPRN